MKTVLITGANSGIGKSTAITLASKGFHIMFIARDELSAEIAKQEIISVSRNNAVDYILADLLSLKEVRRVAEKFKKICPTLDILINNAGVCLPDKRISEDGFEAMFQINHLSHFLLTNLLMDMLKKSEKARIINVSSAGYRSGTFDIDNLQSEKKFGSFSTYCNTKLLNILFTFELAELLKNTAITANCLHPGVVNTNFAGEFRGIYGLMGKIFKPFLISPEKGAATSIYLATSEEVSQVSGKYFEKCSITEPRNKAINIVNQKILWVKSMELAGITEAITV